MIEATGNPAMNGAILAHALGEDPAPAPAGPDLTDKATRDIYVIRTTARLASAERELQQVYMIRAAQEVREAFPEIDCFKLNADGKHLEMVAAWDAGGNDISPKHVAQSELAQAIAKSRQYLEDRPDAAVSRDPKATAVLEEGLRIRVDGPRGWSQTTDMGPSVGGQGSAPSPGWLLRSAAASWR
jgi:hypothetical protein